MMTNNHLTELKRTMSALTSWVLTERQLYDVEMILNQGFSPLTSFLCRQDYESVLEGSRLSSSGKLWPIPVVLDVPQSFHEQIKNSDQIALKTKEGTVIAVLEVEESYKPDKSYEAIQVFGTTDVSHPGVDYLMNKTHDVYLSGKLKGITLPAHHEFKCFRFTPEALRNKFEMLGWDKVIGFQTRNPMHKAHIELTLRAIEQHDAHLLINPVVGTTKPGDIDYITRIKCYQEILKYYPEKPLLALLPLSMRMAGPREALWHALIRKNYGCTHFIVGRDHAGPGKNAQGKPFYDPYAAQDAVREHQSEIGIEMVPFVEMVYVANKSQYVPADQVEKDDTVFKVSGTELRNALKQGKEIPSWFSYPEVINTLRQAYPEKSRQGFTVFFTGFSGSGKSTIANALLANLLEHTDRKVTLLDGDLVRRHLSSELGFSREHRDLNILRIGYVASEITKHRGIALCAPIAPFAETRREVRKLVAQYGGFIEVYVSTPIEICEQRDPKGLYARVRSGNLEEFTGISMPYEAPVNPEVEINTDKLTVDEAVHKILDVLHHEGYLKARK